MRYLVPLAAVLISTASSQTLTETFDGPNVDDWGIDGLASSPTDTVGGNPGGRLVVTVQSSTGQLPAPTLLPRALGHPWGGNWRTEGVTNFSYDRQVEMGSSNFGTIPFLLLGNGNGTPNDFSDDSWVWVATGDNFQFGFVPWTTISVPVDSQSNGIPTGWDAAALPNSPNAGGAPNDLWDLVIQDVTYVGITTGVPFNGSAWFGAHVISYDNFVREGSGFGSNYCPQVVPNTSGLLGTIAAFGSSVASDNNLSLLGSNLPDGQFAYFVGSQTQGFVAQPSNSQGNLCVLGNLARFNAQVGATAGGQFSIVVDLTSIPEPPSLNVSVMAGDTWNFQLWHRDTIPGQGPTSNFTDAIELSFF